MVLQGVLVAPHGATFPLLLTLCRLQLLGLTVFRLRFPTSCLSSPVESMPVTCLISVSVPQKAVPFGIHLSAWGNEEELVNSESRTRVGLGVHRATEAEKGQAEEVISGCMECRCVHPERDYVAKHTHRDIKRVGLL